MTGTWSWETAKSRLMDRLEEARAKLSMDRDGGADDSLRDRLVLEAARHMPFHGSALP